MPEHIIIYASTCVIPPAYAGREIDRIVATARARNANLGLTGALFYSERHFAQAIEGDRDVLARLMQSIRRDPRHKDIVLLEDAPIGERRFGGWSLAYAGPSIFVDQIIVRSIYEAKRASTGGLQELLRLMAAFAAPDSA